MKTKYNVGKMCGRCVWCNEKKSKFYYANSISRATIECSALYLAVRTISSECVCVHCGEVRELNGRMQNAIHRTAESFLFARLDFVYECMSVYYPMYYIYLSNGIYWSMWLIFFLFSLSASMCVHLKLAVVVVIVFTLATLIAFIKKMKNLIVPDWKVV